MPTFFFFYFLLSCEWRFFFLFVTSSNILYPHFSSSKQMEDGVWERRTPRPLRGGAGVG